MKRFTYINAKTIDEAISVLEARSAVMAGGTDLLGQLKDYISPALPETLVNIKTIPGLDYIREEGGMLKIGSLTRLSDISMSSVVREKYTTLAQAAGKVGTPELRNMGTIGGNICQLNRCWYYRADHNFFNCLRKNASGLCYALAGDNRYHSIFGATNGCVAVNPSDVAPALVVLNAKIVTTKQTVEAGDFFTVNGEKTTILEDNEIVKEIQVPAPITGTKSAFVKYAIRKSFDFAIVNCAASISSSDARICLNGVHNLPRRATTAENSVKGKEINETNAETAGEAAISGATALPGNKYKVQIAKTLVKRAILACK